MIKQVGLWLMCMLKQFRLWLINLVKCSLYLIVIYSVFSIFEHFELLSILDIDILPVITKGQFLWLLGIIEFLLILAVISRRTIQIRNYIKKNAITIEIGLFLSGVILLKKYFLDIDFLIIVTIELAAMFILMRYYFTYIYIYDTKEKKRETTNFTERPVIGKDKLTTAQTKAYEELLKIVKRRTKDESINIALIGEWGKGKTSVTESLVRTLQESKKYFVLKINTQTFNATSNIIEYVKEYFFCLFEKYGVQLFGGKESVAFLSSLGEMLSEVGSISSLIEKLKGGKGGYFVDIESERELFSQNVRKLLAVSNKNNIVLIVDDADRSESKKEVLSLLSEFSSIRGILSIISLDKNSDLYLQPGEIKAEYDITRGINDNILYDELDKYIHVRVRIEDSNHIEYESNVTNQILSEYDKIYKQNKRYINCNEWLDKIKIFGKAKDFQTSINNKPTHITNVESSIMTDIFFENLKNNNLSFGEYLEFIVCEYVYRAEELWPHMFRILQEGNETKDILLWKIRASWTNLFRDQLFDWLMQLQNNSYKAFSMLCGILDGLVILEDEKESIHDICNMKDIFEYYNWKKHPIFPEYTWKRRKDYNIDFGIDESILLVFNKTEQLEIECLIAEHNYKNTYKEVAKKLEGVVDFYIQIMILSDFIQYMRRVTNNYRLFKMQLREAEIKDVNYLDYLLKQWQPNKICRENIENVKNQYNCLKDFQITWPTLKSFVNMILFYNYLSSCRKKFPELKNWKECKVSLFYGNGQSTIIISGKENEKTKYISLDVSGANIYKVNAEEDKAINELLMEIQ